MRAPDEKFWDQVRSARERLLALDYDGTLAHFQVDRLAAKPLPGIIEVLNSISKLGTTRLAIISGRPVAELEQLIGTLSERLILVGSHGWERREPGGGLFRPAPPAEAGRRLAAAYDLAREYGQKEPGLWPEIARRVEKKNSGVAVHTRGMAPETATAWLASVRAGWSVLESPSLEIMEFNGGIELRARSREKGLAVREVLERFPRTELIVYLGDDVTDEDVFRTLREIDIGIGIKVGDAGETSAACRIRDVDAVREFLGRWERTVRESIKGGEG